MSTEETPDSETIEISREHLKWLCEYDCVRNERGNIVNDSGDVTEKLTKDILVPTKSVRIIYGSVDCENLVLEPFSLLLFPNTPHPEGKLIEIRAKKSTIGWGAMIIAQSPTGVKGADGQTIFHGTQGGVGSVGESGCDLFVDLGSVSCDTEFKGITTTIYYEKTIPNHGLISSSLFPSGSLKLSATIAIPFQTHDSLLYVSSEGGMGGKGGRGGNGRRGQSATCSFGGGQSARQGGHAGGGGNGGPGGRGGDTKVVAKVVVPDGASDSDFFVESSGGKGGLGGDPGTPGIGGAGIDCGIYKHGSAPDGNFANSGSPGNDGSSSQSTKEILFT